MMKERLDRLATSCRVYVRRMATTFTHWSNVTRNLISRVLRTLTRLVSLQGLNSLTLSLWMKVQAKFSQWCETTEKPTLSGESDNILLITSFCLGLAFMALVCFIL